MYPPKALSIALLSVLAITSIPLTGTRITPARATVFSGGLEGQVLPSGMRVYRGVPYAAPPIGYRRWGLPEPVEPWSGVREAHAFGPRCMQPPNPTLTFRSPGSSEDCLYLNVWTPSTGHSQRLPVLVYFHGGGFSMGDSSEPRHDGERLAREGLVVVTANYRLGVLGFLAHPDLRVSGASGNYGLLDQVAVLRWVQENVAAFGGDAARVTIAGPSAGSEAVHALMASPLAKSLLAGAIGSSGSLFPPGSSVPVPLTEAERKGEAFLQAQNIASVQALRALPSEELLERSVAYQINSGRFPITVDGTFLHTTPADVFAVGHQAHVPLLLGSNSYEQSERAVLLRDEPTESNYRRALERLYGARADDAFRAYPASSPAQVTQAAADMSTDRFMGYPMWKWAEEHTRTSKRPVYRYIYTHPRPVRRDAAPGTKPKSGAAHGDEIEYAFGTLDTNTAYAWTEDDRAVSRLMLTAYATFIKTGRPRLAVQWPAYRPPAGSVLYIGVASRAEPDRHRARYLFLDTIFASEAAATPARMDR